MRIAYITRRTIFSLPLIVVSGAVVAWTIAAAAPLIAAEKDDTDQPAEISQDDVPGQKPAAPPDNKNWKEMQRLRNEKALIATPASPPNPAQFQALQERMRQLQREQEDLSRKYQEALMALQQTLPGSGQPMPESMQMQKQLEMAQMQMAQAQMAQAKAAELAAKQLQAKAAPLPPDAVLKVFTLKYVKPDEAGLVLNKIMGGGGPRVAVDERTNALLIAGDEKQASVVEALIQKLDQPGKAQENPSQETVQARIVWLLDGLDRDAGLPDGGGSTYREPTSSKSSIISPQVIDALRDLGFEHPQVVCQQLNTLTVGQANQPGQFHFQVPVLIGDSPWQFQGQGAIRLMPDEHYAIDFNMSVQQPNNPQNSQLSGSIITPLGHYTVLGTTTFVSSRLIPRPPAAAKGEGEQNEAKTETSQHLSAFVVYLDRAREFRDNDNTPEKKAGRSR
jgi:hypothetical protein